MSNSSFTGWVSRVQLWNFARPESTFTCGIAVMVFQIARHVARRMRNKLLPVWLLFGKAVLPPQRPILGDFLPRLRNAPPSHHDTSKGR